ncbi:unnamed protein product [Heterobilharzia americana]|nr:unnamed protein product [Heterobilharzia americana]
MSPPPTAVKSNLHPIPMKPFVNPVTSLSADCAVQSHSTLPQKVYMEDSSMITSDPWSSANIYTVNSSASHPRPITQNLPYSMSSVNTHCGITPETNRLVPSSQFINHATSTGVMDSFYSTHPLQNRLTVPITNSLADSVRSATDVDSELQQAQRQARTQEFRNAVERAQQARARQRLSESCSADSDSMLSKSALGLLSTMPENRPISSVPSPFVTTACQAGPNYLFSMSDPSVSSVLNVPAHGLLPQAFPTSGPLDITTAIAAATAAAMAYTGGSDGGVPVRSGMEIPISVPTIIPHTQVPISVSSNTAAAGSWQAAFASGNSMPAALVRLLSQQPHMAQLLQNALNMSVGSSAQGVFVNPEFFVERFLEIFNQPQINRSPGPPVSSSKSPVNAADSGIRSNLKSTTQAFSNLDDSASQNMEFDGSSEKAHRVHKVSQLSIRPDAPTVATSATVTCSGSSAQRTSRVPGLMDIKVYCASSQHLAHLWDKEDNLLDTGNRAFRGRGRNLTSHKLQRSGTRGHGTARSHLLDSVTSDFKSMNLRDTDDRQYPLEDFDVSYRAQSMSKSSKPWSSKPSHSVDDTALDSYNASARTKSGFACDDHIGNRKQTRNIPDDNFWIRSDLDINSPFISSSEDDIDECGVLSDVQEAEATEEDKGYEQSINDLRKKVDPRLSKFSQPNQTAVADNQDRNRNSSTYNRRGRRGRVATGSHFTSSRSYTTDDFSSYSKRYSKGSEHDYYWRQQYVSSSRGFRAGQSTGSNTDQHKNRSNDDIVYKPSERSSRSATSGSFTGNSSGYLNGRMTRSYGQYESSHDHGMKSLDNSHYIPNSPNGRQIRSQKIYYGHKGQFSSATEFSHHEYVSDEEENKPHVRTNNHSEARARSYATSGRFHKSYRRNTTKSSELNNQSNTEGEQVTIVTCANIATVQTVDIDDSDVPTVRVPASDSVVINHYSHTRNRAASQKVLVGSKRPGGRGSQNHQQSKRLEGSVVHSSRRYREMRDRYNDEKDGDGGAAAGGTGRSATSSGVSASIIFKTGSGSSGCRGGNQCSGGGGGHTDSTADFVNEENHPDNVEVNPGTLGDQAEENTINSRSVGRRRQTVDTGTGSVAGGVTKKTESSGISTSPLFASGNASKSEKASRLSRTNSTNHNTYRSNPRLSRSGNIPYHKRSDLATIPPLMSIKPQASFPENSHVLETFSAWSSRFGRKSDAVFRSDFDSKFSLSSREADELNKEFEGDTAYGDGFTKVVSKASKYFARRRMQQEVAFSSELSTKRSNTYTKAFSNVTQMYSKEASSLPIRSQNHSDNSDLQSQSGGASKSLSGKKKYFPNKVTFMGPPMCLDTTDNISSMCAVTTSIMSNHSSQPVTYSCTTSTPTSSVLQKISISTTRTWSKVVGTKFANAHPENHCESSKTSTSVLLNSSAVWQTEHTGQGSSKDNTGEDNRPLEDTTNPVTTSNTDRTPTCAYTSMQSLWSATDTVNQSNKNELASNSLLVANSTVTSTTVSSVSSLCTVSPSTTFTSQISNNICKVKPQQQQLFPVTSISSLLPTSTHLNPLSPSNNVIESISTTDLIAETERSDFECCSDIGRSNTLLRPYTSDNLQNSTTLSSNSFQSWSSSNALYTPFSGNPALSNIPVNHHENMFSTSVWPTVDQGLDVNISCLTGPYNVSSNHHFQNQLGSNVLNHNNNTLSPLDSLNRQPNIPVTPRQQHMQSYQSSLQPPTDRINIYSNGHYGNNSAEVGKLSTNICVPSQQMTFVSGAPSLYVHPQSTEIQPAHSRAFHPSLSLPIQPQMNQSRKCRQQVPHHIDPSTYPPAYTSFPTDLKSEYNYPPSITGCIPPPPTGGLYSAIHAPSQPNYPQNSGRQTVGFPTTVNSWSLLGNPSAASSLQGTGQPYAPQIGPTAGNGGGLLPHPVPQGGYSNAPCHFPTTSNSASNYANQSNYVGVIGGGRPNADHSNANVRQRSLQHHSLFTHPNLPQSPSAQGQQSFQLPSSFYPSISPSHQRVSLQQFGSTSARGTITGPINPQSGLYGPPFGGASHPPNQATPPPIGHQLNPMGFFNNPFQYPTRPDGLH